MAKSLVVVESPAKARTINKYLGKGYIVKASLGHVLDLPKSKLGVDEENDFLPTLTVLPKKKKVLDELKKAAKRADTIGANALILQEAAIVEEVAFRSCHTNVAGAVELGSDLTNFCCQILIIVDELLPAKWSAGWQARDSHAPAA